MSRIEEIRAGVAYVGALLTDMHERANGEPFDAETKRAWEDGTAYVEENRSLLEEQARREKFRDGLKELMGTASEIPGHTLGSVNFNKGALVDPFDHDTLRAATSAELEDRSKRVIGERLPHFVTDEQRSEMENRVSRHSSRRYDTDVMRRHIIRTSSPEYIAAFDEYVQNPRDGRPKILRDTEARAAMSLTAANGGVLVPQFLDPTIILTNAGAYNQVRQLADVVSITTDQWDGVTSAGVDAAWLAEGAQVADNSPTFVGPTISVHKAAAWLFGSYEMIADAGFGQVGMLIADAKDRLEMVAHASGNGSGQPFGLFNVLSGAGPAVTGTSSNAGVAGTFQLAAEDPYKVVNALDSRWQPNASFLTTLSTINALRGLTDARTNYWQDFGRGQPSELLGYPVYRNEAGHKSVVSGANNIDPVMILGDFRAGYKIVDRVGVEIIYEPLVMSTGNGRPTGQAGWFAFWRSGANVITSNAFRTLCL